MMGEERQRAWFRRALVLASLAIHLLIFRVLFAASLHAPKAKLKPIEVTLSRPLPPVKTPPPEPQPKKIEPKKIQPKVAAEAPPPKAAEEPPPPPIFGISLSSVGQNANGFNVRVGNTTMAEPDKGPPAKDVRPLSGNGSGHGPAVSLAQVSKMPTVKGACPPGNPRDLYTPAAIEHEVEGRVQLEITIDEEGKVSDIKLKKGLGYGLDEAAEKAMREQCHFDPAEMNGKKVTTVIRYDFSFVLDQ